MRPGEGPGVITDDGCAVELYRQLAPMGEAEIVHASVPAGTRVLDLGSGAGRIAHRLVELGHEVTAVDQSAEMLAHVQGAETVCAPIIGLDLGRTFDAVLMASHLVNVPDDDDRRGLLQAGARHLSPEGVLVAEWHPPAWFDSAADGAGGTVGEVRIQLADVHRDGDRLSATVRYWAGDDLWTQTFTALRLDEDALRVELHGAGLEFGTWADDAHNWFTAERSA